MSDIKQNKFGTKQPSELKKDIIITSLDAITKEIKPSGEKISKGDLSGFKDYFTKTGKYLQEFGKDVSKDPYYYLGNTETNAVVIASTFGVGELLPIVRSGLKSTYQKQVTQPKAQSIIEYAHPPKNVVKSEFQPTGKTMTSKSGIEISEYKKQKVVKPETETIKTKQTRKTNDPDFDGSRFIETTEPTGKTRTQKVSPIESFERVSDTYGHATYKATFKKGSNNKFQSVEAIMTPNPILRYTGKPQPKAPQVKSSNTGIKLDEATGSAIKKAISDNPSQSKQIFESYAVKGKGGQFFERPSERVTHLASFDKPLAKGEIGKIRKVSPETADAMGARGTEIATQESFFFDDLFVNLSKNKQYGNLLQEGKIKTPQTTIPKQTLSLDSQYFNAEYLSGETSLATAYEIKTRQPSKFEKMTPYEKQFFDETQGFGNTKKNFKPAKSFELKKSKKTDTPKSDSPLELLTKKQQDKVLTELKGGGDFAKTSTKTKQDYGLSFVNDYDSGFATVEKSALETFDRPKPKSKEDSLTSVLSGFEQSQDADLLSGVFTGFDQAEKQDSKLKSGMSLIQTPQSDIALDLDIFKDTKQSQPQKEDYGFSFYQDSSHKPKTPPALITDLVTDTPPPIVPEFVPEEPPLQPPPKTPIGGIPLFDFQDMMMDELLYGSKKSKGKKRFHNVDPTIVLGHFDGGSLGYQSTEFTELTRKGKKGRKKKQDLGFDFSQFGF